MSESNDRNLAELAAEIDVLRNAVALLVELLDMNDALSAKMPTAEQWGAINEDAGMPTVHRHATTKAVEELRRLIQLRATFNRDEIK
jgi:hypothetical protein